MNVIVLFVTLLLAINQSNSLSKKVDSIGLGLEIHISITHKYDSYVRRVDMVKPSPSSKILRIFIEPKNEAPPDNIKLEIAKRLRNLFFANQILTKKTDFSSLEIVFPEGHKAKKAKMIPLKFDKDFLEKRKFENDLTKDMIIKAPDDIFRLSEK